MPAQSTSALFELALQRHKAGQLGEASDLYAQVLEREPSNLGALYYRGAIAAQLGQFELAAQCLRRCVELKPDTPQYHHLLGASLQGLGELEAAAAACEQAVKLQPAFPAALNNLGAILSKLKRFDAAIAAYQRAIDLQPNAPAVRLNLANALLEAGRFEEALDTFLAVGAQASNMLPAHQGAARSAFKLARHAELIAAARRALALDANQPQMEKLLADALLAAGDVEDALAASQRALALDSQDAESHYCLGNALRAAGKDDEAIGSYRSAVELSPQYAAAYCNLGTALSDAGRLDEAEAAQRCAIAINPDSARYQERLAQVLANQGRIEDAITSQQRALEIEPGNPTLQSKLMFYLAHDVRSNERTIADEYRRWDTAFAQPLLELADKHANYPDPDRRLRIAYVSRLIYENADWHDLLPLLGHHDHTQFEICIFSDSTRNDSVTRQARAWADDWLDTAKLTDAQLADAIRARQIDVAVLHLPSDRALAMARKPAPVQISWLLSGCSSGIGAMDYRISDPFLDMPAQDDGIYTEKTYRLPRTAWCFDPLLRDLPISSLPSINAGHITFGSISRPMKTNPSVIALWSQVLNGVPGSRFLTLCPEGIARHRIATEFERNGVSPERVTCIARLHAQQYLEAYNQIDIVLDTFPYNGHNTTRDALWMGVPVVTLAHRRPAGRVGFSLLHNLDLGELATPTPADFVSTAIQLASNRVQLQLLRHTLRDRMQSSPLMDAPAFAREMERAYRAMWRQWVARNRQR